MSNGRALVAAAVCALVLSAVGPMAPKWLLFLITMSLANGLAVLGVVVLTRGGGATFGQGMFFAIGAYVAALTPQHLGITDAAVRVVMGTMAAGVVGAIFAPLLARYRGIFFAMLTLALSMVLFGLLSKSTALGGSDGISVARPTAFGRELLVGQSELVLYWLTVVCTAVAGGSIAVYWRSAAGLLARAVHGNALRVEYLGASARRSLATSFIVGGLLGGLGGAITALALGHVEPNFSNWTTSGEFVFVAVLAGYQSIVAVFVSSLLLEVVRSFSNLYFPNTWQLVLGSFLLLVIVFRPAGLGSLWSTRRVNAESKAEANTEANPKSDLALGATKVMP